MIDPIIIPVPVAMKCHCAFDAFKEQALIVALVCFIFAAGAMIVYSSGWLIAKLVSAGYRKGKLPKATARKGGRENCDDDDQGEPWA